MLDMYVLQLLCPKRATCGHIGFLLSCFPSPDNGLGTWREVVPDADLRCSLIDDFVLFCFPNSFRFPGRRS